MVTIISNVTPRFLFLLLLFCRILPETFRSEIYCIRFTIVLDFARSYRSFIACDCINSIPFFVPFFKTMLWTIVGCVCVWVFVYVCACYAFQSCIIDFYDSHSVWYNGINDTLPFLSFFLALCLKICYTFALFYFDFSFLLVCINMYWLSLKP